MSAIHDKASDSQTLGVDGHDEGKVFRRNGRNIRDRNGSDIREKTDDKADGFKQTTHRN